MKALHPYFVSTHDKTGVNFFLIPNAKEFANKNTDLLSEILSQCENVESQVWVKKFSVYHSTFDLDYVVLMYKEQTLVGFASVGLLPLRQDAIAFYVSEVMILKDYQNKGLASSAISLMQEKTFCDYPQVRELYAVVLSGHLALFRCFLSQDSIKACNVESLSPQEKNLILDYLNRDIQGCEIDRDGIVRGAWSEQKIDAEQVWPTDLVKRFALPKSVDLSKGDALMRVIKITSPSSGVVACT